MRTNSRCLYTWENTATDRLLFSISAASNYVKVGMEIQNTYIENESFSEMRIDALSSLAIYLG